MWDGLLLLLCLSAVMGVASFLAGLLPLSFGLSQNHSRAIGAVGTGLLVGACLIIIIPEGVETLYSAVELQRAARVTGPGLEDIPRGLTTRTLTRSAWSLARRQSDDAHGHGHDHDDDPHAYVGLALIAGFVLMYLIDKLPAHAGGDSDAPPLQISLANLSQGLHRAASPSRLENGHAQDNDNDDDASAYADGLSLTSVSAQGSATTIGLVIHAAADGIALAASSFLTESSVGFVVFIALMVHKAPAAFGLTSVLLKQGLSKRQARAHLLVFSLAAPVGAISTWLLVTLLAGGQINEEASTRFWTGLLLIFSGGTFLYVAMHTMEEGNADGASGHSHRASTGSAVPGVGVNGYAGAGATGSLARQDVSGRSTGLRDTGLCVLGMLLPLLAQAGHAH